MILWKCVEDNSLAGRQGCCRDYLGYEGHRGFFKGILQGIRQTVECSFRI